MLERTEGECSLWRGSEGVRDVMGPGTYGKEDWPGLLAVGEETEMSVRTQGLHLGDLVSMLCFLEIGKRGGGSGLEEGQVFHFVPFEML